VTGAVTNTLVEEWVLLDDTAGCEDLVQKVRSIPSQMKIRDLVMESTILDLMMVNRQKMYFTKPG